MMPQLSNFVISRAPVAAGEDPSSAPLLFWPPKDSEEFKMALKESYSYLKSHKERMRQAMIDFYLSEDTTADDEEQVTLAHEDWMYPTPSSTNVSPISLQRTFSTPSTSSGSSHPSPASFEQAQDAKPAFQSMVTVWNASSQPQPKSRVRKCMSEQERKKYRENRMRGACDECKRRKRECDPAHPRPAKATKAAKATKVSKPSKGKEPAKVPQQAIATLAFPATASTVPPPDFDLSFLDQDMGNFDFGLDAPPELTDEWWNQAFAPIADFNTTSSTNTAAFAGAFQLYDDFLLMDQFVNYAPHDAAHPATSSGSSSATSGPLYHGASQWYSNNGQSSPSTSVPVELAHYHLTDQDVAGIGVRTSVHVHNMADTSPPGGGDWWSLQESLLAQARPGLSRLSQGVGLSSAMAQHSQTGQDATDLQVGSGIGNSSGLHEESLLRRGLAMPFVRRADLARHMLSSANPLVQERSSSSTSGLQTQQTLGIVAPSSSALSSGHSRDTSGLFIPASVVSSSAVPGSLSLVRGQPLRPSQDTVPSDTLHRSPSGSASQSQSSSGVPSPARIKSTLTTLPVQSSLYTDILAAAGTVQARSVARGIEPVNASGPSSTLSRAPKVYYTRGSSRSCLEGICAALLFLLCASVVAQVGFPALGMFSVVFAGLVSVMAKVASYCVKSSPLSRFRGLVSSVGLRFISSPSGQASRQPPKDSLPTLRHGPGRCRPSLRGHTSNRLVIMGFV